VLPASIVSESPSPGDPATPTPTFSESPSQSFPAAPDATVAESPSQTFSDPPVATVAESRSQTFPAAPLATISKSSAHRHSEGRAIQFSESLSRTEPLAFSSDAPDPGIAIGVVALGAILGAAGIALLAIIAAVCFFCCGRGGHSSRSRITSDDGDPLPDESDAVLSLSLFAGQDSIVGSLPSQTANWEFSTDFTSDDRSASRA
jgi:hypothetical protein